MQDKVWLVVLALAMFGCGGDQKTVNEPDTSQEVKEAGQAVGQEVEESAEDVKEGGKKAADKAEDAVDDDDD